MANLIKFTAFCVLFSLLRSANSANILALMGCASHSHHLWNEVIYDALVKKGHTLTVVSVDTNDTPNDSVSYVHLEETYNVINDYYKKVDGKWDSSLGIFTNVRMLYHYQTLTCKGIILSRGFQTALKLEAEFDLILYDVGTGSCLLRLIELHPGVPVVAVSAFKMTPDILSTFGGHSYPAYVPLFVNDMDVPMGFFSRLYNTASYAVAHYFRKHVSESIIDAMVKRHFPESRTSLESLYDRLEIALVNTHPATDQAQSLPPNIIEVGGLHIKEPAPLPTEIRQFIEAGERGAVLISLGTNLKAENLGEERLQTIVNVIKKLPKWNFLWKVETEGLLKEVPENLLIRKWFPQNDILAHPSLSAFLTHAGGLSIQEATWHGVPVVAMPFFLDQIYNAQQVKARGCGRVVDYETLDEKSLFQGLFGVLGDETYRLNMIEIQKQFRDRQNKPLDTALWWIEYVLRNPRRDHLVTAGRNMSYFIAHSLDFIFILFAIGVIFLVDVWAVIKRIQAGISKSKAKPEKKKKDVKKLKKRD